MKHETEKARRAAVRSSALFSDWVPIHQRLVWYRFGKLVRKGTCQGWEIPLPFGWIFETPPLVFDGFMVEPGQNHNPGIYLWRRRFLFYKRKLDPIVLPVAKIFLRVANWIRPPFPTADQGPSRPPYHETITDTNHPPYMARSPINGRAEWMQCPALYKWSYCEVARERTSDAGCSDSYMCAKSPNDKALSRGGAKDL